MNPMNGSASASEPVPVARQLLVLSDLHITPAVRLGNFSAGKELANWTIQQVATAGSDSILVLNGDIFDFLLVEKRPSSIELSAAALLVKDCLDRLVKENAWAECWRKGLKAWSETGSRIILIPGNHDPEFYHPDTTAVLNRWVSGDPDKEAISVWRKSSPWHARYGPWEVVVGHGHRADAVNDINPDDVHAALFSGRASTPIPPGSELVLGPLAAAKRALNPITGQRRFPFLDAVKPETHSVLLLLLYLDPGLVLRNLPKSLKPVLSMINRSFHRRLFGGPALGTVAAVKVAQSESEQSESGEDASMMLLADALASDVFDSLTDSERRNFTATQTKFETHLESDETGFGLEANGALGIHGGPFRPLLRAWLRREGRKGESFFQPAMEASIDKLIIQEQRDKFNGPVVVIAGHTHAARQIEFAPRQVYINTGTWTNLIDLSPFKDDDKGLRDLIDAMASDSLTVTKRLTWASVNANEATLQGLPTV